MTTVPVPRKIVMNRDDPVLCFKLEDINGQNIQKIRLDNGNVRLRVNANFRNGAGNLVTGGSRTVGFEIEAKTERIALEMIEAYGRQMIAHEARPNPNPNNQNRAFNFAEFHQKRINKPIPLYAGIKAVQDENGLDSVTVIFYKHMHPRNDLVYYFGGKRAEQHHHCIEADALQAIKDLVDGKVSDPNNNANEIHSVPSNDHKMFENEKIESIDDTWRLTIRKAENKTT